MTGDNMKHHFIYAYDQKTKEMLIAKGYVLLYQDESKNIYRFENKKSNTFSMEKGKFAYSNQITF